MYNVIEDYTAIINSIIDSSPRMDNYEKNCLLSSIDCIEDIAENESNIEQYFTYIANGSYKACYDLSPNFVIKFTVHNRTLRKERLIFKEIKKENLSAVFADTWFIDSDVIFKAEIFDEMFSCLDNESIEGGFDCIIIQRKVYGLAKDSYTLNEFSSSVDFQESYSNASDSEDCDLKAYERLKKIAIYNQPIITKKTGFIVDIEDLVDCSFIDNEIISLIIKTYGIDFFIKMARFFGKKGIYDLHTNNFGLYDNELKIIDFLSCGV